MKAEKQIEFYEKIDKEILDVTKSKRSDYANEDVLSNFKGVSQAAHHLGIDIGKSEQYAMFMVLLKICRLTNLLNSNKTPINEAIKDSFLDAINYMKLSYCCYEDLSPQATTEVDDLPF